MLKLNFDKVRPLFGGTLTQTQVDGINYILDEWNRTGNQNRQWLAYALATTKWETAHTMQPLKETGTAKQLLPPDATVIARLDKAFAAGKLPWVRTPYWRSGWFGRGFVQLTHEYNYKGKLRDAVLARFKVDIHKDRDQVLNPNIAAYILVWGMMQGVFTSRSLIQSIDDLDENDAEDFSEFVAARAIINGKDRAKEIAELALGFEACIEVINPAVVPLPAPKPRRPTINVGDWLSSLLKGKRKVAETKQVGATVVTEVESSWASKVNWTMALGIIFTALTFFGVPVDDELKLQIIALGNALFYVVGWVLRTFFSPKVPAASTKKL